MDINTSMNAGGVNGLIPARRSESGIKKAGDKASFTSSAALEGALDEVPDSRPEAVERARELINNPDYPSSETIQKLSGFLAARLTSGND